MYTPSPPPPPLVRGFVGVCCRVDGLTCVAKALELFMDRIIKAVADETKARGARRVTPSHLYVSLSFVPFTRDYLSTARFP